MQMVPVFKINRNTMGFEGFNDFNDYGHSATLRKVQRIIPVGLKTSFANVVCIMRMYYVLCECIVYNANV